MHNPNPTDKALSSRELIFNFLVKYKSECDGNTPTTREIADACSLSISTVKYHLTHLELENRIRVLEERPRQIEVIGGAWTAPRRRTPSENEDDQPPGQDERDSSLEDEPTGSQASHT
jgi:SOS-response transcriptional repressor LexA